MKRRNNKVKFLADSDDEEYDLDLNASEWEIIDKPVVNTSGDDTDDSADDDDKRKKKAKPKRAAKKKKPEATTKRLPPWKIEGDLEKTPGFHCLHRFYAQPGIKIGGDVAGPLLGNFYVTRLALTSKYCDTQLRGTEFCHCQELMLPTGHWACLRVDDARLVTWRIHLRITLVAGDKWGDALGEPTIIVAHFSDVSKDIKFFGVPMCDFIYVDSDLRLSIADDMGTIEKVDKNSWSGKWRGSTSRPSRKHGRKL